MVSFGAVGQVAAWLERAGDALCGSGAGTGLTPAGGWGLAVATGRLATLAHCVWLVPPLAGARAVRRPTVLYGEAAPRSQGLRGWAALDRD